MSYRKKGPEEFDAFLATARWHLPEDLRGRGGGRGNERL